MVWNDVNACFTGISLIVTSICRWVPFNWHLKVKFNISHQAVIYLHYIHHNNNMSCSSLAWAWCSLRPTLQWLEFHFPLWTAMLRQGVRSGTLCGLGFCQTSSCFFFVVSGLSEVRWDIGVPLRSADQQHQLSQGYDSALNQTGLLISHWSRPL